MRTCLLSTLVLAFASFTAFASPDGNAGGSLLSAEMAFKAVNFILLLFLLYKFARKPIAKMLSNSAENTKKTIESTKQELAAAKGRLSEYESKIASLEQELKTREDNAMSSIVVEKEKMIADAREQAQKLEEQALNRIEQDVLKAKAEIKAFLVNESIQFAEKLISSEVGKNEHKALVDNYVKFFN